MGLRVDECIARINETIDNSFSFLDIKFISEQKLADMIGRLQVSLPQDMKDATAILQHKDEIIAHANREAERIQNEAMAERNRILSSSELIKAAQQEANIFKEKVLNECEALKTRAYADVDSIRLKVNEEARRMREGADGYADQVLAKLEDNINKLTEMLDVQKAEIKNVQNYMEQRKIAIQQSSVTEYQQDTQQSNYERL